MRSAVPVTAFMAFFLVRDGIHSVADKELYDYNSRPRLRCRRCWRWYRRPGQRHNGITRQRCQLSSLFFVC